MYTLRALAQALKAHPRWRARIGFRPSGRREVAKEKAAAQSQCVVDAINEYARREDAAVVAPWEEVKGARDARRLRMGLLIDLVEP
jgi:hypothetical protein